MTSQPFNNNASKKEREQFVKDSYHNRYQDEVGGRWAKPTQVSGKDPATLYPKLPTTSPWSNDPVPPEAPLGIDISEPPIVGESWEVEASLDREFGLQRSLRDGVATPASGRLIPDGGDVATPPATVAAPSSSSGTPRPADEDLGEVPHVVEEKEGGGNTNGDREGAPPSRSKLKRRLV